MNMGAWILSQNGQESKTQINTTKNYPATPMGL